MRTPLVRAVATVTVVVVAAAIGGCGLGDKQADAEAIVEGTKAVFGRGTATGTMSVFARVVEVPEALGSIGGVSVGGAARTGGDPAAAFNRQAARPLVADVVFDFDDETAALTIPGQVEPFAVFRGLESYGRRYTAGERDARPWVRLDLQELEEGSSELSVTEDSPFIGGFALNPIVLFDLAAGPLTGSIEETGSDEVAGTRAVRFDANFDIDKVLRDTRRSRYDEDRREAIDEVLNVLAVRTRTHGGQVWLDADGLPRRFTIRLREEPIKRFKIDLVVTFELAGFGTAADVAVPTPRERVEVDNVVQFLRSTIPAPTTPEFLAFLGVAPPTSAGPAGQERGA